MRRLRHPSAFAVGLALIVVTAVGLYLAFGGPVPFTSPYEVRAMFRNATQIKPDSPVRIAGVEVGKVTAVGRPEPGSDAALVTMAIDGSGRPIHADARARIRPRIFLEGNFYVELSPGTPGSAELRDGGTIPMDHTSSAVQFDQVLSILRSDTRGQLKSVLGSLADAQRAGAARAFNRTLRFQAPAYKATSIVSDALLGQGPHDLSRYVRAQGVVSGALDRSPEQLRDLISSLAVTLGAFAREESALRATIRTLPGTLRTAGPALDALDAAFPPVRRFAAAALPAVRSSGPTIDALVPLVGQLRGLVSEDEARGLSRDLRAAIPSLDRLSRRSIPLLDQTRLASSCQNQVILPWSRDRIQDAAYPASGPVYEEAVKWLPGLGGESRSFDANGQWFKVLGTGGLETFQLGQNFGTGLGRILGVNPPPPPDFQPPPLRPDVPCETQQPPDLRSNPLPGPQPLPISSSPATQARAAKAREVALALLRSQASALGVKVFDRNATMADVEGLARIAGNVAQLARLRGAGR